MSIAIRYIACAVMLGVLCWVLFVVLIFWTVLIRAVERFADLTTEDLARLRVRAGSLANTAWERSRLGGTISAFRAATQPSDRKPALQAERVNVAHLVH